MLLLLIACILCYYFHHAATVSCHGANDDELSKGREVIKSEGKVVDLSTESEQVMVECSII